MATISSLGVGSGLDLAGIVNKLMQVEQQPLFALQTKEAIQQARISGYGSLKAVLAGVQSAAKAWVPATGETAEAKFASFKTAVADTTIASATATTGAVSGTYSLEVTALAQAQRLVSLQNAAYTSSASELGVAGTLVLETGSMSTGSFVGAATTSIDLTATQTLGDLRDAINAANAGVSATIITTTNAGAARAQLVLTSNSSGIDHVMKLTGLTGFEFDPDGILTSSLSEATIDGGQAAQNAAFKLNGIATEASGNVVTGVLDGVTLTLLATNVGTPTTLTVTRDATSGLKTAVSNFIKAFNAADKGIDELGLYDPETKKTGTLQGNPTLRTAQSQLRTTVLAAVAGSSGYQRLSDIGVTLQRDGTLKLDSSKLDAAVSADFEATASLIGAIGSNVDDAMEGLVGVSGTIAAATDSANRIISGITSRSKVLTERLTVIEARYRRQFAALDSLISGMNQTSSFLQQQLASLPGVASG